MMMVEEYASRMSLPALFPHSTFAKKRKREFMPGKTIKRQRYLFEIASPPSLLIIHFEMRSPSKQMK